MGVNTFRLHLNSSHLPYNFMSDLTKWDRKGNMNIFYPDREMETRRDREKMYNVTTLVERYENNWIVLSGFIAVGLIENFLGAYQGLFSRGPILPKNDSRVFFLLPRDHENWGAIWKKLLWTKGALQRGSFRASHPAAPGLILGVHGDFFLLTIYSLDVAKIHWWHVTA